MISGEPSYPSCEAFIKPEFTPPIHSNEIAEPLVSKLVGYYIGNAVPVTVGGCFGVEENSSGSAMKTIRVYT